MSNESAKVIVSLIGVGGLLLYGYLILIYDTPVEYLKYTVILSSLGILYPLVSLSNNEYFKENQWKVWMVGLTSMGIILIAGYSSKVTTNDGLIWDFYNAVSSEGYRLFYFVILIAANICALASKKLSLWCSAFTIGFMSPVILASIIIFAIIVIGLIALGSSSKSNSVSSWTNIFNSSNPSSSSSETEGKQNYTESKPILLSFKVEWKERTQPLTYTAFFNLPANASVNDFKRELYKLGRNKDIIIINYRRGNDPTIEVGY